MRAELFRLDQVEVPCDKASFSANARPHFKIGQIFRYKTFDQYQVHDTRIATKSVSPDKIVMKGRYLPLDQTIRVEGRKTHGNENCFVIQIKGTEENPLYEAGSKGTEKTSAVTSTAYVNDAGKVLYYESKVVIVQGANTSMSISRNEDPPAYFTVHYFYGYWMLALHGNFLWECKSNDADGPLSMSLRVVGREKVDGNDCFVVQWTETRTKTQTEVEYWVDSKERIVRQVAMGGVVLRRIV